MCKNISLFTLQTFSSTGGIQKMTRTLANALYSITQKNNGSLEVWSLYDSPEDLQTGYLPQKNFKAFAGKRIRFIWEYITSKNKPEVILLSHINLAVIALLTKMLFPKRSIWLIAHGIEVWQPLSFLKRYVLKNCDKIVCVSNFTKEQLIKCHQVKADLCTVLNNTFDPFMRLPGNFTKPAYLLNRYGLNAEGPVIFTLARLDPAEQYKGYDQLIRVVARLKVFYPEVKYILAGSYDETEKMAVEQLITNFDVAGQVILTGFIAENELTDHYLMADVFVLPSKGEGFGIVLIEALACGLPVICGNADGSMDAICNGDLGTAIDADNLQELEKAIINVLAKPLSTDQRMQLQSRAVQNFNMQAYINKLQNLLTAAISA